MTAPGPARPPLVFNVGASVDVPTQRWRNEDENLEGVITVVVSPAGIAEWEIKYHDLTGGSGGHATQGILALRVPSKRWSISTLFGWTSMSGTATSRSAISRSLVWPREELNKAAPEIGASVMVRKLVTEEDPHGRM